MTPTESINLAVAEVLDHLESSDLPAPDELIGSMLSPDEATENIDAMRVLVRPDLWEMGEDGKARKKVVQ